MSERKNIDKLFQEKFKDFEAEPPEEAWSNIEIRLKEKKKDRKVIPFWWKLSGVAAALLLGFILTDSYLNRKTEIKNNPVVENSTRNVNDTSAIHSGNNNISEETAVAQHENTATQKEKSKSVDLNQAESPNSSIENVNDIVKSKSNHNSGLVVNESPGSINGNKKSTSNATNKRISNSQNTISKNQLAVNAYGNKFKGKSNHTTAKHAIYKTDPLQNEIQNNSETAIENKSYINESAAVLASQNKTNSKPETPATAKTITTDITANAMVAAEKKKDSTGIATVVPNALEELLNERENNLVTKEPHLNRWQITSSVAPIYFGSTSNGSPIDSTFAGNSKNYKTNLSIGLGVNYAISKKLKIRTGISQVTFNYNTNDVYISAGMQGVALKNVTPSSESQFINFGKQSGGNNLTAGGNPELLTTDKFQSYINQRMGYIEVPLELSYSLIDKRFGVNVIGGISTLFLNENKIVIVSDGMTSSLGEASNLNKTHFSSNIGLGVKYRIYKAFQANFEPMFKYQLNTFSKDDGDFKPYYFGLYTGLSYSF
jgi:hypothetical protein